MTTTIHDSTGILISDPGDKIGKLIRLMASTLDGEALGAVRALDNVLRANGCDFHYLASIIKTHWTDPESVVVEMRPRPEWQTIASRLLTYPAILLEKEFDFLNNMSRSVFEPTQRQWKWLADIESEFPRREASP